MNVCQRPVSSVFLASPLALAIFLLIFSSCPALSQGQNTMASSAPPPTVRVPKMHRVDWTPEGVRNYTSEHPLVVELRDIMVLVCDRNGDYAYSNLVVQHSRSQYDECNCMTAAKTSCESSLRIGYCAMELSDDITVVIAHSHRELNSVVNFSPGEQYFFVSYSSSQDLGGSQSELFAGGDCSNGLKMSIMVAREMTQPPPTTPTSSSNNVAANATENIASSSKLGISTGAPDDRGKGRTEDNSKPKSNPDKLGSQVMQSELTPARKLKDWHIGAIVALAGLLLLLVVVFAVVVFVVFKRHSAVVAPSTDSENCGSDVPGIDDKVDLSGGTVVQNKGAETDNQTNTAYPEGIFHDPLDNLTS